MMIFICDPGLFSMGSHHFNWSVEVAAEFGQLGLSTKIFGYAQSAPEVLQRTGAIAHFADLTYTKHDGARPFDEEQNWLLGNESFKRDMERLEPEIARPDAIVILPAATQHQIEGVAQWFEALAPERRPNLAISLMFFPQWTPWGDRAIRGPEYYARAIERLKPWIGQSVLLYTENSEIQKCFEQLTRTSIAVLPIPWAEPRRFACLPNGDRIRFGFLGHSRRERGFHLLPAAADICNRQRLPFDLIAQIHHNHFDAATILADDALRSQPNVSTIIGPLEREQYYRLIDFCDVIVLAYDPSMYRTRGSGLFAEAVMYGKPVIITAGTAMENASTRGECAAEICEFNSVDLARAMSKVCSRYAELEAQATCTARAWREVNNVGIFCRKILAFAEARSGHPIVVTDSSGGEMDETDSEVPSWPLIRPGAPPLPLELVLRIQDSVQIEFTPFGLHSARLLVLDVGLDHESNQADPVKISLEMNGHILPSITVTGGRCAYHIPGPFPWLKDGLPTILEVNVVGGDGERMLAMPVVYGMRFLPAPAWARHLVRSRIEGLVNARRLRSKN